MIATRIIDSLSRETSAYYVAGDFHCANQSAILCMTSRRGCMKTESPPWGFLRFTWSVLPSRGWFTLHIQTSTESCGKPTFIGFDNAYCWFQFWGVWHSISPSVPTVSQLLGELFIMLFHQVKYPCCQGRIVASSSQSNKMFHSRYLLKAQSDLYSETNLIYAARIFKVTIDLLANCWSRHQDVIFCLNSFVES